MVLSDCPVSEVMAMLPAGRLFPGHQQTRYVLTSALHMINHRHHRFSIHGSFVYILDLHDLEVLKRCCKGEVHISASARGSLPEGDGCG